MDYLLEWYLEVRGLEPLSFAEIESWARLVKITLEPWEVRVIKNLDNIYWKYSNV